MKRTRGSLPGLLAYGALCLAALGCGAKKVTVRGHLTLGSKPLKGAAKAPISVYFCTYQEGSDKRVRVYPAEVNQDEGTYQVTLPVGKYRIAVIHSRENLSDKFKGAFSQSSSKIIRDVNSDGEINLDLSKPTG